ncbi:glycosyltransferase [candidate division GN15 bacterium]|nr:glycosyltransferase [candidate division GN15 bacterium]
MSTPSQKIKIAYVIDNYIPGGGSENQLITLINHLDRTRFEPCVFNMRGHWSQGQYPDNCPVTFLNVNRLYSPRALGAIQKITQFIRDEQVDIVQVYFVDSRLVGSLAARRARRAKLVYCRRDLGMTHRWLRRRLARMADYCIVNAERVRQMVVDVEQFPADRIEVIYNGVALKPDGSPEITRQSLQIPEGVPIVGVIANYRPVKRLDRFLHVASSLSNKETHFLLIGRGQLEAELRAQAEALGIADRCRFFSTVDHIRDVLDLLTIGVSTSESEGLSNVVIEYALAGKPAVAFDVGGNSEIIDDGRTGYIIPLADEPLMLQRIEYLLANPEARLEMGAEARVYSSEKFDVKTMVHRTESFYERVVNGEFRNK